MTEGTRTAWRVPARARREIEWPTLALLAAVHGAWAAILIAAGTVHPLVAALLLVPALTLHSSLQHEVLHGHPFRDRRASEATVALPLGLLIPYGRFRTLHLAHHHDPVLTDPYDDPEANYLDPARWGRMGRAARLLFRANNTLAGRMAIGPILSLADLYRRDVPAMWRGDRAVRRHYAAHALGAAGVLAAVAVSALPLWAYLVACYGAVSLLKIRTFAEHRAHHAPRARTVVIEDRGPLAFLFLNNNFHAVHHARPALAWYRLPAAYAAERRAVLRRNDGYRYASYWPLIRDHLLRAKDPVPHPLWTGGIETPPPPRAVPLPRMLAGTRPPA